MLASIVAIGAIAENAAEQAPTVANTAPAAEPAPATAPVVTATPEASPPSPTPTEPSAVPPTKTPEPAAALTTENSAVFAEVMSAADGYDLYEQFAGSNKGRTIQFDGVVAAIAPHGDYTTRFDILVYGGDSIEAGVTGPSFQFKDVSIVSDLNLTGSNIPDTLAEGQKVRVTAVIQRFDRGLSDLFFLDPVSTEIR